MSQVAGPYGLRVVKNLGETPFSAGMHTYVIQSPAPAIFATQGLFFGDPVGLTGGSVVPLSATPAAGVALGVFQGASWQDPIRGFVNSQFLPAGLLSAGSGVTQALIKVQDYPWAVMRVQANGPVTTASIGLNAALGNFASGSVNTGNSQVFLVTPPAAAAAAVRIYGFPISGSPSPGASSVPGDPYTDVLVVWNFGISKYLNATGA